MSFPAYSLYGEGVHGGNIASWIAVKRPEKVQALLLASPGFPSECVQSHFPLRRPQNSAG